MTDEILHGSDPFSELKRSYEDYKVFDAHFENMGKVHDLFVDEVGRVRYISIGSGLLNMDFIPIPVEVVRLNDKRQVIEVDAPKHQLMHAPTFSDPSELTRENEDGILRHFGIKSTHTSTTDATALETVIPREDSRVDLTPGERDDAPVASRRPIDESDLQLHRDTRRNDPGVGLRRFTR